MIDQKVKSLIDELDALAEVRSGAFQVARTEVAAGDGIETIKLLHGHSNKASH